MVNVDRDVDNILHLLPLGGQGDIASNGCGDRGNLCVVCIIPTQELITLSYGRCCDWGVKAPGVGGSVRFTHLIAIHAGDIVLLRLDKVQKEVYIVHFGGEGGRDELGLAVLLVKTCRTVIAHGKRCVLGIKGGFNTGIVGVSVEPDGIIVIGAVIVRIPNRVSVGAVAGGQSGILTDVLFVKDHLGDDRPHLRVGEAGTIVIQHQHLSAPGTVVSADGIAVDCVLQVEGCGVKHQVGIYQSDVVKVLVNSNIGIQRIVAVLIAAAVFVVVSGVVVDGKDLNPVLACVIGKFFKTIGARAEVSAVDQLDSSDLLLHKGTTDVLFQCNGHRGSSVCILYRVVLAIQLIGTGNRDSTFHS